MHFLLFRRTHLVRVAHIPRSSSLRDVVDLGKKSPSEDDAAHRSEGIEYLVFGDALYRPQQYIFHPRERSLMFWTGSSTAKSREKRKETRLNSMSAVGASNRPSVEALCESRPLPLSGFI